ncbi:MAG: NUDIX hydrolase [Verrucomicrobiota bacterium]
MRFHQFVQEQGGWKMHSREVVYSNPFLEIQQVFCSSPARPEPFVWTVCHRKAGVAVAAQTPDGGFVMIRQERVPVCSELWEFPAGQIDEAMGHDDAAVVATGLRELREESGYELAPGGEITPMQYFMSSPGYADEHTYLLWVRGVVPSLDGAKPDTAESISEARVFSGEEVRRMVATGEVRDANTLCCLAKLSALGVWGAANI